MQERNRSNEYRTTVVCVDSYKDGILAGRFYNLGVSAESFKSLTQFLLKMEDLLDGMRFPQAFTTARAFAQPPDGRMDTPPPDTQAHEGKLATFSVRVIFRQNASWQGSIGWLEGGREESFRSVLELILLMDSALSANEKAK